VSIRPRKSLANPELWRPRALDAKPRSPGALWLDKNENFDPDLLAVGHEVLRQIPATALASYPEAGELYRKLAPLVGVAPEQLLLTPGSDGAIRLIFEAFVEHGDGVVHTDPTFAMYPIYGQMFGADVLSVGYRPSETGPELDPDLIVTAVRRHRPKLVCLPNPDSPSGTIVSADVLRMLLSECEAAGAILLVDEAYYPFHDWSAVAWTATSPNLVIARTFAKAWSAAGLRIGYAVAHTDTISVLHKMRPMYEVGALAVEFMTRMLDRHSEMLTSVARIKDGKAYFVDAMRAFGLRVLPTRANFVHVAFGERASAVHAALADKVLYRAATDHPCLAGYSRFTVAPRPVMARVVELIRPVMEGEN
jgi:histidinol-phosphate aminotransferase